jgi:hypothetical protein
MDRGLNSVFHGGSLTKFPGRRVTKRDRPPDPTRTHRIRSPNSVKRYAARDVGSTIDGPDLIYSDGILCARSEMDGPDRCKRTGTRRLITAVDLQTNARRTFAPASPTPAEFRWPTRAIRRRFAAERGHRDFGPLNLILRVLYVEESRAKGRDVVLPLICDDSGSVHVIARLAKISQRRRARMRWRHCHNHRPTTLDIHLRIG